MGLIVPCCKQAIILQDVYHLCGRVALNFGHTRTTHLHFDKLWYGREVDGNCHLRIGVRRDIKHCGLLLDPGFGVCKLKGECFLILVFKVFAMAWKNYGYSGEGGSVSFPLN